MDYLFFLFIYIPLAIIVVLIERKYGLRLKLQKKYPVIQKRKTTMSTSVFIAVQS